MVVPSFRALFWKWFWRVGRLLRTARRLLSQKWKAFFQRRSTQEHWKL